MIYGQWELGQQNLITFVMIDPAGNEVAGLGAGFTLGISKNGNPIFTPSAGTKGEMSNGWYKYLATVGEADTRGTISIMVTGAGCKQQNLEYVVAGRNLNCIPFTYTVTDGVNPLEDVECCFSIDAVGNNIIWKGYTDIFGVARDSDGNLPCLDAGTYYVWRKKTGYIFVDPDVEVVS